MQGFGSRPQRPSIDTSYLQPTDRKVGFLTLDALEPLPELASRCLVGRRSLASRAVEDTGSASTTAVATQTPTHSIGSSADSGQQHRATDCVEGDNSHHPSAGQSTRSTGKFRTRIVMESTYLPLQVESLPEIGRAGELVPGGKRLAGSDPDSVSDTPAPYRPIGRRPADPLGLLRTLSKSGSDSGSGVR